MVKFNLDDLYTLDPIEFERLVGRVFVALGYAVKVTKRSGDDGIDLDLRRGDERSIAQCKRYRGTVRQPAIRDFFGVVVHERADRGYFVTTGQFSLAALTWAQGKPIALTDGIDLLSALSESGVDLAPRARDARRTAGARRALADIVEEALTDPARLGRILIDGPPPDGHGYDEVASYLESSFPGLTDAEQCQALKGSFGGISNFHRKWGMESDAKIRVLDEFDSLSRPLMEQVLQLQVDGVRSATLRARIRDPIDSADPEVRIEIVGRRQKEFETNRHQFVLVATVWEKRLPKAVRSRFHIIIPSYEIDWHLMAASVAASGR